jgi:hypothetical protein
MKKNLNINVLLNATFIFVKRKHIALKVLEFSKTLYSRNITPKIRVKINYKVIHFTFFKKQEVSVTLISYTICKLKSILSSEISNYNSQVVHFIGKVI